MRLLEIRLHGQNLLQRFEGLSVLETLRRAPQDKCPRQMSLRQHGVKHQGPAAVVFRLLQPSGPRVEAEVHVRQDIGQPGMRQRKLRVALDGRSTSAGWRSRACPAGRSNSRGDRP